MAKPLKLKEARNMLKRFNCKLIRIGSHEIWERQDGQKFTLPAAHRIVSAGIARQLTYFVHCSPNHRK